MSAESRREAMRRAGRARYAAIKRLVELHLKEFNAIYKEEAAKEGVVTAPDRRRAKITRIETEVARLRETL